MTTKILPMGAAVSLSSVGRQFSQLPRQTSPLGWVLALAWMLGASPAATAQAPRGMCTNDTAPAATLMVPYFEVDLDDPSNSSTLVYVHNTAPEPTLLFVTLWTDWGLTSIGFNLFLTGYDAEVIDLADLFMGNIPITADEQSDLNDTISPHGDPSWDGSFSECINFFPFFFNPAITGSLFDYLLSSHTGQPTGSQGKVDECRGEDHGDNIARGWITLDVVDECSFFFPSEFEYSQGPDPVLTAENRIVGDAYLISAAQSRTAALPVAHVQADPELAPGSTVNGTSFYGRFDTAARDRREALGSTWAAEYFEVESPSDAITSSFLVWRDPSVGQSSAASCAAGPDWRPLSVGDVSCFDDRENVVELCQGQDCLGLSTQVVSAADLEIPFTSGWCRFDLAVDDEGVADDIDFPAPGGTVSQAWVVSLKEREGVVTAASLGAQLESACGRYRGTVFFGDGFESGGLLEWTSSTPP